MRVTKIAIDTKIMNPIPLIISPKARSVNLSSWLLSCPPWKDLMAVYPRKIVPPRNGPELRRKKINHMMFSFL